MSSKPYFKQPLHISKLGGPNRVSYMPLYNVKLKFNFFRMLVIDPGQRATANHLFEILTQNDLLHQS